VDYEETVLLLDGIVGTLAHVYPWETGPSPDRTSGFPIAIAGLFKREEGERKSERPGLRPGNTCLARWGTT
jgi:hypothetical protein